MTENNDESGARNIVIWSVPCPEAVFLFKCLSYLDGSAREDVELWFEPFRICRYARVASQRVYGPVLPTAYSGNESQFAQVADGMFVMLKGLHSFQQADPYLLSYEGVQKSLETSTKLAIVKDSAVSVQGCHKFLPSGFRHVFLIQDPSLNPPESSNEGTASQLLKGKHLHTMDTGDAAGMGVVYSTQHEFGEIYQLWKYVKSHVGPEPLIIDATDLMTAPKPCVERVCQMIGVDYREDNFDWQSAMTTAETQKNGCIEIMALDAALEGLAKRQLCERTPLENDQAQKSSTDVIIPDCDSAHLINRCIDYYYRQMYRHRFISSSK